MEDFKKKCKVQLDSLEKLRIEKLVVYNQRIKVGLAATVLISMISICIIQAYNFDFDNIKLIIIPFALVFIWARKPKAQYIKTYKDVIIPELVKSFGNFIYKGSHKILMADMLPSKIIPSYTTYVSEDYFSGRYKGVNIEFAEIKLVHNSGKHSKMRFDGIAILLKLEKKKFHGHTIINRNTGSIKGALTKWKTGLKPANMVDPEFEKLFDIYTDDQVEARYLIDMAMIESLKKLNSSSNVTSLTAAFYGGDMLILMGSNYNHFEPADLNTPANMLDGIVSTKEDIDNVLSIIDVLDLYDPRDVPQ